MIGCVHMPSPPNTPPTTPTPTTTTTPPDPPPIQKLGHSQYGVGTQDT
jgi:hypothetical protein